MQNHDYVRVWRPSAKPVTTEAPATTATTTTTTVAPTTTTATVAPTFNNYNKRLQHDNGSSSKQRGTYATMAPTAGAPTNDGRHLATWHTRQRRHHDGRQLLAATAEAPVTTSAPMVTEAPVVTTSTHCSDRGTGSTTSALVTGHQ